MNKNKETIVMKPGSNSSMFYPDVLLYNKHYKFFDLDKVINIDSKTSRIINRDISIFIINLQKNVGKTVWMTKQMNQKVEQVCDDIAHGRETKSKFAMMFRTEAIMKARRAEINNDPSFKFFIKSGVLYAKGREEGIDEKTGRTIYSQDRGTIVGATVCFNTMGNDSGHQYTGFYAMYYDEYRAKTGVPVKKGVSEFKTFTTFVSSFMRMRRDVKFYLFGNNEPGPDYICEGMGIAKDTDYIINNEIGFMYINMPMAFKGMIPIDNLALKLSRLDEDSENFITSNIAMESDKGIISKEEFKDATKWGYLLLSGAFYEVMVSNDKSKWLMKIINELEWNRNKESFTYGFQTLDVMHSPRIQPVSPSLLESLTQLYRFNRLCFWSYDHKSRFQNSMKDFLGNNYFTIKD